MLYEFDHQHLDQFVSTTTETAEATDEHLMERIQARDEAALNALYRRHKVLLRSVIGRVVNNVFDEDELLQEVFVELWNRGDHFDQTKGKALGWIITLARRRAIDRVRRRQAYFRATERMQLEEARQPRQAWQESAEEETDNADRAEIFQRILATLPTAQREAVDLAFYRGLSQREIAARTGTPLGTVKTRLELGVRKVRAAILALGGKEDWLPLHG